MFFPVVKISDLDLSTLANVVSTVTNAEGKISPGIVVFLIGHCVVIFSAHISYIKWSLCELVILAMLV